MPSNPSKLDIMNAVEYQAEHGDAFYLSDAGLYGWDRAATRKILRELEQDGKVIKVDVGVWELKPEEPNHAA